MTKDRGNHPPYRRRIEKTSLAPSLPRVAGLMALTSALTPVIGIASAPLLAHGLGVADRGALSVITAPNTLLVGVATIGMPEAITYFTARQARNRAQLFRWASIVSLITWILATVLTFYLAPILAGPYKALAPLIVISAVLAGPALVLGLVRALAVGLQAWRPVALEKSITSILRLATLATLLLVGQLNVLSALLVATIGPLFGVLLYWRVIWTVLNSRSKLSRSVLDDRWSDRTELKPFLLYGTQTWFGSVAAVLLARLSSLLFAPFSSVEQLGLFSVASTIADVPLIVSLAIRDAVFGVSSRAGDREALAKVTRISVLFTLGASILLGASLPFWISIIFGVAFSEAVVPTELLLMSAILNTVGFLSAAALAAWGRPLARTVGLLITLIVNLTAFLMLVPPLGAIGAALAAVVSALVFAEFMVVLAARTLDIGARKLLVPTQGDLVAIVGIVRYQISSRLGRG